MTPPRATAQELASHQRDISVSEFFVKNRHLLGFDSPSRALLTAVKEAVDNALDACEEAGIVPEVWVEVRSGLRDNTYEVSVEDNGPGIVEQQIGKIFGKLLYGSRFHRLTQSRGQQGIGISAAGMYGQLTTGKPMRIVSRTEGSAHARELVLSVDTRKNRPHLHRKSEVEWGRPHGTRVEMTIEAVFVKGAHSVEEYLRQTAVTNPHVTLHLKDPHGVETTFTRKAESLPPLPKEIKPHPYGVELGRLIQMLHGSKSRHLKRFLTDEFSRVGSKTADRIIATAKRGLTAKSNPHTIARSQADALHRAILRTKISAPDTSCVVPIGEASIVSGLRKEVQADFYAAVTRPPAVYRGNPFVVEAGVAYGGRRANGGADDPIRLMRFANRVPLLYQQAGCAITKAVTQTNWKAYGLTQPRGALPLAPMVLVVHVASVWVPFTSESKEAIASYPEIQKELRLALQDLGRRLRTHRRRTRRLEDEQDRRNHIETFLPHVGEALQEILTLSDEERRALTERLDRTIEEERTGR